MIPSFVMLIIQFYIPSNLYRTTYGELQRLINQNNMDSPTRSEIEEKLLCKICLERDSNTGKYIILFIFSYSFLAFLPCNHSVACNECSDNLKDRLCPICREPI